MSELDNITPFRFSIPDYNSEQTDLTFDEKVQNLDSESRNLEKLEEIGFFAVINNPEKPKQAFEKELEIQQENRDKLWEGIDNVFNYKIKQYENQIDELKKILNAERENLKNHSKETKEEKQAELKQLKEEIENLKSEIKTLSLALAEKKEKGIGDRIKQVREELRELVTTLEEITKKRDQINDDNYNRDKEILKISADFWDKLSQKYEATLEALKGKSLILFKNGINIKVAQFFIFTGITATILAGWLFAIFSSERKIDDEDWLFFILESLYSFGDQIQSNNNLSDWQWILIFLSSFLLLITIITVIGWGCKRLFKSWFPNHGYYKINDIKHSEYPFNDKDTIIPNFLVIWLQQAPYIFIASVVYIIIQIGTDLTKLKDLDISLSGQAVGSGLALIIGGLGFLYITNIIIPRFKDFKIEAQKNLFQNSIRFLGKSLELVLLMLIFLVTFVIMYFSNENNENGAGALMGFVTTSLIAGYLLGTGLRFKGLLETKRSLENRFINLKVRSYQLNTPLRSSLNKREDKLFVDGFLALENELFQLLNLKTRLLNPNKQLSKKIQKTYLGKLEKNEESRTKKKRWSFKPLAFFKNIFKPKKAKKGDKKADLAVAHVTEYERNMFPVEVEKIEFLEKQRLEKIDVYNQTYSDLKFMSEERWPYQIDVKKLTSQILEQIDHCQSKITIILEKQSIRMEHYLQESIRQNTALQNGFDLGNWFLKYGTDKNSKS